MVETTVTAFAPPMRVDVTHQRSSDSGDESVTVKVSAASVFSALETLSQPWAGWMAYSPFRPWVDMMRALWAPLALENPRLFAVTFERRAPPIKGDRDRFAEGFGPGVTLEGDYRRVD
ncbi:MAG: hypothetical protein H7840_13100 [Alphaproteobacteria bacterium]